MFKSIAKAINQNKKNKLVRLITVLSVFYIFTPYISHAAPQCTGDSTITPSPKDIIFYGIYAPMEKRYTAATIKFLVRCDYLPYQNPANKIIFKLEPISNLALISNDIYYSGLSGVGLSITLPPSHKVCTYNSTKLEVSCSLSQGATGYYKLPIKINLLALDFKSSGIRKLTTPDFRMVYYMEYPGPVTAQRLNSGRTGSIEKDVEFIPAICTLNTQDINFNLGVQQKKDFIGVGPKGSGKTQKISLTCNRKTKYSLQVNGDAEPGYQGVIKLTPGSGAATGLGVQLLANNNAIQINRANEIGETVNHGTNLPEEIDITARYYQTENTVTPGTANASATFTMTYQ